MILEYEQNQDMHVDAMQGYQPSMKPRYIGRFLCCLVLEKIQNMVRSQTQDLMSIG